MDLWTNPSSVVMPNSSSSFPFRHVRLWNIPDKHVVYWTLIPAQASSQITAAQANLITAVHFCDEGRKVCVGTFDGRFLLYNDSLQYDVSITDVKNVRDLFSSLCGQTVMNIGDKDGSRSHRSRKKCPKPYKITGIESMNSNNSRVRQWNGKSAVSSRILLGLDYFQRFSSPVVRCSFERNRAEIPRILQSIESNSSIGQPWWPIHHQVGIPCQPILSHPRCSLVEVKMDGSIFGEQNRASQTTRTMPVVRLQQSRENSDASSAALSNEFAVRCTSAARQNSLNSTILVHNTMVTSAIFAPNPNAIVDFLYATNASPSNENSLINNRSVRSIPSGTSTVTPLINHHNRTRLICVHASSSPTEASMSATSTSGNTYIMVTADSKGQLKLLVNRLAR